jgi:hypothetical protein
MPRIIFTTESIYHRELFQESWEQLNCSSTFSTLVELYAELVTCKQQKTDDVVDEHMWEASGLLDKEDEDENVSVPSQLDMMSAINTIINHISSVSVSESSSETVYKLEKEIEDIHIQRKSKHGKRPYFFWK